MEATHPNRQAARYRVASWGPVILALVFFAGTPGLSAQESGSKKNHPNLYTGVSAVVLPKDATEINLINSASSFWVAFNEYDGQLEAMRVTNRVRYTRADHLLRISHGFSRSGRWDLGADLYYTRVRVDDAARSTPGRVYTNRETPGGKTYSGLSAVGVQARLVPFAHLPELTLRVGMSYPLARTEALRAQLGAQRTQYFVSGAWLNRLGPAALTFLQGDFRAYLRHPENEAALLAPSVGGYLLFELPRERWYIFPGLTYNAVFQQFAKGYPYRFANQQLYGSLGVLFRPREVFNVLVSTQIPFLFDSGSTRAIWVRESYSGVNVGLRFIL